MCVVLFVFIFYACCFINTLYFHLGAKVCLLVCLFCVYVYLHTNTLKCTLLYKYITKYSYTKQTISVYVYKRVSLENKFWIYRSAKQKYVKVVYLLSRFYICTSICVKYLLYIVLLTIYLRLHSKTHIIFMYNTIHVCTISTKIPFIITIHTEILTYKCICMYIFWFA